LSTEDFKARVARVRRLLLVIGLLAVAFWPPGQAWPHAYLVRSVPAARSTITQAPERVQLWFNERLEPAYSRVSVWSRAGRRVDVGDVQVAATEPTRLSVGVPRLAPGAYTVKYRVLSVDGHVVEAEFGFTVRSAGP
jgi:methionine-rich copper-binding protein CopC